MHAVLAFTMRFLSSTPVLWPVWFVAYVLLCTSYTFLALIPELPRFFTLAAGLPAFDVNASLYTSSGIVEKLDREIPGVDEVLCGGRTGSWIAGTLVFYCISTAICSRASRTQEVDLLL